MPDYQGLLFSLFFIFFHGEPLFFHAKPFFSKASPTPVEKSSEPSPLFFEFSRLSTPEKP